MNGMGRTVIGAHPSMVNAILAGACSGRGFTLAPTVDASVARRAVHEAAPGTEFMSPERPLWRETSSVR